ncbi:chorismate-binding protein [Acrocarpospora macrocephala]|uniref:isochorismate synthase n=1 Tax=Acrocarpospora macrocephala TaxID=150177 RepID=A0A5M3WVW0_9ACTN|nr:isochorismate synthase [Acrocarpospora macrocephala]GES12870.1 isochorismate synthase [Acrocarpospora macrocephala]
MELVRTVKIDDPGSLLEVAPHAGATLWLRGGDGMVAWGEAARLEISGPDRFDLARRWWRRFTAVSRISDEVERPGSGPIVFGSFTFDDGPGKSVLIVPRVVIGRRDGIAWKTTVGDPEELPRVPWDPLPHVDWRPEPGARARWHSAVTQAVQDIKADRLEKVVLARDLRGRLASPFDPRTALARLTERFPSCWSFAVDGLVGASPELLASRHGRDITSLVLAGTAWPGGAHNLVTPKNSVEHSLAADSAIAVLEAYCDTLDVPTPHVLRLANVTHLATMITGTLSGDTDALALAGRLHPTAAVCGTPTHQARELLRSLECLDRDRYAAPVGWQDSRGDGEWCIALRCARVSGQELRLFAGCGIVAGSSPAAEWQETEAKLGAVRDIFGVREAVGSF